MGSVRWFGGSISGGFEMICDKMQGLLIRLADVKDNKKAAYIRRRIRDHLESCAYCYRKRRRRGRAVKRPHLR